MKKKEDDAKNSNKRRRNQKNMVCGIVVGNSIVHIGFSSPAPGARLKQGGGSLKTNHHPSNLATDISSSSSTSSSLQSQSRHAEMDAMRYFRRHDVRKAHLVILRLSGHEGRNFGDSRPCLLCIQRIMRYHPNVSSVTYHENARWYTESPQSCSMFSRLSSGDRLCNDGSRT